MSTLKSQIQFVGRDPETLGLQPHGDALALIVDVQPQAVAPEIAWTLRKAVRLPATVSQHTTVLKEAGLVLASADQQRMCYWVNRDE